jgi:hypothetical protein
MNHPRNSKWFLLHHPNQFQSFDVSILFSLTNPSFFLSFKSSFPFWAFSDLQLFLFKLFTFKLFRLFPFQLFRLFPFPKSMLILFSMNSNNPTTMKSSFFRFKINQKLPSSFKVKFFLKDYKHPSSFTKYDVSDNL